MTPPDTLAPPELADLAAVPLANLPSLPPATLERALRRVLPARPVQTVLKTRFSSGI